MKIFFICLLSIYIPIYLFTAIRTGHFLKSLMLVTLTGIGILSVLHIVGGYFGLFVPFNIYTLLFCGATGISGNIFILISQFLFL